MKFQSIAASMALATLVVAKERTRCGTVDPPPNLKTNINSAANRFTIFRNGSSRAVDTYVHVVTTEQREGAYIQQMVNDQMETMNDSYGPSGISFNLVDTDFTTNDDWATATMGSSAEFEMKSELHQGTYETLNLYFLSDLGNDLLGFCYFPVESFTEEDLTLDGCIHLAATMPGTGEIPEYGLGLTAVHETGHWFGLFHVFQGQACSGEGDFVSDTPIQSEITRGCPASQDSCPNQPGPDNIHNFMDYSYDECLEEFTRGQNQRMLALYDALRAGK